MPTIVPSQDAELSIRYTIAAVNAYVDPSQTGDFLDTLSKDDRAAFEDVTTAINTIHDDERVLSEDGLTVETDAVIKLVIDELSEIAGPGLRGNIRRRRASNFLWRAISTAEYPGHELSRYDPSIPKAPPTDIWNFSVFGRKHTRYGLVARSIAKIAGI